MSRLYQLNVPAKPYETGFLHQKQAQEMNFQYVMNRLWLIPFYCIITCAVARILFGDYFMPLIYLIPGIFVIVAFVIFYKQSIKKIVCTNERIVLRNLFFLSFILRLLSNLILYCIYIHITGTPQHPDAVDAIVYHNMGIDISREIHNGIFDPLAYAVGGLKYDDIGYGIIVSILYAIFGPYYLVVRIFHALIGAWTVVFGYKIMRSIWGSDIAIKGAVLLSLFPSTIYVASTHNKETSMIFFTFMFLYAINNIFKTRQLILKDGIMVFIALGAMIFLRLPIAILMMLTGLSGLLFQTVNVGRLKTVVYLLSVLALLMITTQQLGVYSESMQRVLGYAQISNGEVHVTGRSAELYVKRGQSYAKYLSAPLGLTATVFTPFPSLVKTNIKFYGQTEQWWQLAGLFIWAGLSYFSLLGLINSIRYKFNETYIIWIFIMGYMLLIGLSNYAFSIRFNMIKIPLMLLLVVPGIVCSKCNIVKRWNLIMVILCIVIIFWNFAKIAGRGLA